MGFPSAGWAELTIATERLAQPRLRLLQTPCQRVWLRICKKAVRVGHREPDLVKCSMRALPRAYLGIGAEAVWAVASWLGTPLRALVGSTSVSVEAVGGSWRLGGVAGTRCRCSPASRASADSVAAAGVQHQLRRADCGPARPRRAHVVLSVLLFFREERDEDKGQYFPSRESLFQVGVGRACPFFGISTSIHTGGRARMPITPRSEALQQRLSPPGPHVMHLPPRVTPLCIFHAGPDGTRCGSGDRRQGVYGAGAV